MHAATSSSTPQQPGPRVSAPAAFLLALLVFVAVFFAHNYSDNKVITDSRWSILVVSSLLQEGDVNLDEYRQLIEKDDFYLITEKDGHLYCYMPLAPYVLATPVVIVLQLFSEELWGYDLFETISEKHHYSASAQRLVASLYVAGAAVCVFLFSAAATGSSGTGLMAALLFAFGTSAWSVASRVLWPHGPSMLALSATLLLLEKGRNKESFVPFAGLPLALAYVIRPTNSVSVVLLSAYVLIRHPRKIALFVVYALPVALLFFAYSHLVYEQLLPPYFDAGRLTFPATWAGGLAGNLFSPGRGLLVYSPFLLFCLYGSWVKLRGKDFTLLEGTLWLIVTGHSLVIASFSDWYGGHSYGPRYLSDMLPYLIYLLLPALQQYGHWLKRQSWGDVALAVTFTVFVLWSVFVHYRGANEPATWRWNAEPVDVNQSRERLWDWQQPQFLATDASVSQQPDAR